MANNLYNYPSDMSSSIPTYSYDPSLTGHSARYGRTDSSSSAMQSEVGINGGVGTGTGVHSLFSWGGSGGSASFADAMLIEGIKRRNEALYHQSALGSHNSIGQGDAMFSTNSLVNRPRIQTASHLSIYPQRPLEKDCAHYMLTRTCKFGDTCKFNHPIWVPVGGMPNWNEVPLSPLNECLPERPGEPDCLYFMRTQKCKFGNTCRFNHPKDNFNAETADASTFPERPHEPICSYYAKTGNCMFGVHCIYNHPKDLQIPVTPGFSVSPASMHNTKGLPIRPEEPDCPFYLRTGSCKYGATCRYSHPEWNGQTIYQPLGNMNLSASFIPNTDPGLPQADQGSSIYPQRPGKTVCHFYMKTGQCKFAVTCKFHHPPNWTAPKEDVELTAAGLPRREGSIMCPFYKKNNHCMYGATCRYDHPPVEEVTVTLAGEGAAATEVNA